MASKKQRNVDYCKRIVGMIPAFLADTLSDRDLESFLVHVHSCDHCYHELETEFMVDRAVSFLNRDIPFDQSFDLTPKLKQELQERARLLRHKQRIARARMVILILTLALILLLVLDLTGIFHVTTFFAA